MGFKIIIKDFDTNALLQNKTIKIINLDTKEQMSGTSNFQGEIIFDINKDQKADFFNVLLSDDSGEYEKEPYYLAEENIKNQEQTITKKTTQKILTPRNYETHPAILYFKKTKNIAIGALKAYCSKGEEKIYNYYLDYQDEIFIADKNEEVRVCAYFYKDIEGDKLISQKQREIDNDTNCYITWTINDKKLDKNKYFGKQISFKPSEFGYKNEDILIIKAYCNNNTYYIKHRDNYKEPYRADGKSFQQTHTIIDALGIIALKIEDKWTLSYFNNKFLLMQNRTKKFIELHAKEYTKLETLQESFKKPNYKASITMGNNCCYITINNQLSFLATTTYEQLSSLALLMQNLNTNMIELPFYYYKDSKYLINIKRYSQDTCCTLSSYEILQKNVNNEYEPIYNKDIAKGVILEPSGPDFILGGYNQRIPEGIYKIKPHITNSESLRTYKDNQGNLSQTLPLIYNNEWVLGDFSKNQKLRSSILIHAGTNILESPLDRTEGCLLIGSSFEDKRLLPHNNDTFLQSQYDKIKNKLNSKEIITQEEKQIIEKYNNASIRSLMHFIQEQGNSFEDFTIYIGNEFSGEEARKDKQDLIILEVVRKWEYRCFADSDQWITVSEFKLTKNNKVVQDFQNKDIKGYIVEPAGINPKRLNDGKPLEQQKASNSDTRIPEGEYEIFWRASSKKIKKTGNFLGKLPVVLNNGFAPELRKIGGAYIYERRDILIHIGNKGRDTLGCLMPNKTFNYSNTAILGESGEMTERLIGAIIRHDYKSYINAYKTNSHNRTNNNVVKNFIVKIKDQIEKIIY